ncbi:MAG: hypothetical protein ACRD1B_05980 [Thermoanaerobaculia bacterium]
MTGPPYQASSSGSGSSDTLRAFLTEAARYWEPRRIAYNLALLVQAGAWVVVTWPAFRPAVVVQHVPEILVLAGLANLCYCAAYLVEVSLHHSSARDTWRRRRWGLWLAGTLFALLIAQYWIGDEIYPSVR